MDPNADVQHLARLYRVAGQIRKDPATGSLGIVTNINTKTGELAWLPVGGTQPIWRSPASTRPHEPDQSEKDRIADFLTDAYESQAIWPLRVTALAGLSSEARLWPAAIGVLGIAALNAVGRGQNDRAIATLEQGLPFIDAMTASMQAETFLVNPLAKAVHAASRAGRKARLPALNEEAKRALRDYVARWWNALTFSTTAMYCLNSSQSRYDGSHIHSPSEPVAPLQIAWNWLENEDSALHFALRQDGPRILMLTEDGEVFAQSAEEVEIEEDPETMLQPGELAQMLSYAWPDRWEMPIQLAMGLAEALNDIEAMVFWASYGATQATKQGFHPIADSFLRSAAEAVVRFGSDKRLELFSTHPGLARAVAQVENHEPVYAEEADHEGMPRGQFRSDFGIGRLAARLYPGMGFDTLVEPFSRAASMAALPPLPSDPDLNAAMATTIDFSVLTEEGVPEVEAQTAPRSVQPPEHAAPVAATTVELAPLAAPEGQAGAVKPPPVLCTEHCLLETDWEIPPGESAFAQAREVAFRWLSEKIGTPIPPRWAEGANEAEFRGFRLETEAGEGLLAIRYEHADHEHVGRRWRAELGIGQGIEKGPGVVAIRLLAMDSTRLDTPTTLTPRLVRDLMAEPGLRFAGRAAGEPWRPADDTETQDLLARLASASRDYAVLVGHANPPFTLAKPFAPLALQVQLSATAAAAYSEVVRLLGTSEVHLFAPGATSPQVLPRGDARGIQDTLMRAHSRRENLPPIPTFAEVRRKLRDVTINRHIRVAQTAAAKAAQTSSDVATMNELVAYMEEEIAKTQAEKRALESDVDTLSNELREVKAALFAARATASLPAPATPSPRVVRPTRFDEMQAWIPLLADRVLVAPKAIREALSLTDYQNEDLVLATIDAMHEHYWPMVFNSDAHARAKWLEFLKEHRLRCGPVGTASTSSLYEHAYQAVVEGKTYTLDTHVQGPSVRDIRRCLRIYFASDRQKQRVIIGIFPRHLPSSLT